VEEEVMLGRKKKSPSAEAEGDAVGLDVHRYRNDALEVALAFSRVDGDERAEAKARAKSLRDRLPDVVAAARSAAADRQPELNKTLSDARLDLGWVLSDGTLPTSARLARALEG
jgi:hypothetical protein